MTAANNTIENIRVDLTFYYDLFNASALVKLRQKMVKFFKKDTMRAYTAEQNAIGQEYLENMMHDPEYDENDAFNNGLDGTSTCSMVENFPNNTHVHKLVESLGKHGCYKTLYGNFDGTEEYARDWCNFVDKKIKSTFAKMKLSSKGDRGLVWFLSCHVYNNKNISTSPPYGGGRTICLKHNYLDDSIDNDSVIKLSCPESYKPSRLAWFSSLGDKFAAENPFVV